MTRKSDGTDKEGGASVDKERVAKMFLTDYNFGV